MAQAAASASTGLLARRASRMEGRSFEGVGGTVYVVVSWGGKGMMEEVRWRGWIPDAAKTALENAAVRKVVRCILSIGLELKENR